MPPARITLPQAAKGAVETEPSGLFRFSSEMEDGEGVEGPGAHQGPGDIKTVGVPLPGVSVAVVSLSVADDGEGGGRAGYGSSSSSSSRFGGLVLNEIGQPGEVVIGGGQVTTTASNECYAPRNVIAMQQRLHLLHLYLCVSACV